VVLLANPSPYKLMEIKKQRLYIYRKKTSLTNNPVHQNEKTECFGNDYFPLQKEKL
jgi:hypothetical protein